MIGLDRLQSKFAISDNDDTAEAGVLLGSFDCTYLGSVPTDNPGGPDVVAECVVALRVRHFISNVVQFGI